MLISCSCFSQLLLLVLLYFLYFSILFLLLKNVKLDNSFCYQVLVEVSMFLISFIFIMLSIFVCIMYFCQNYRKKSFRRCPKAFHNNYNCINHILRMRGNVDQNNSEYGHFSNRHVSGNSRCIQAIGELPIEYCT